GCGDLGANSGGRECGHGGTGLAGGWVLRGPPLGSTPTAGLEDSTRPTVYSRFLLQKVADNEIAQCRAGGETVGIVGLVVDAAVDAAYAGFLGRGGEARLLPHHVGHGVARGEERRVAEEARQHGRRGAAEGAVARRVGRERRGGDERRPRRVAHGGGVAVGVAV